MFNHLLLLVFEKCVHSETAVELSDEKRPDWPDPVVSVKGLNFPVQITKWILHESSNVLVDSPFLSVVSGFLC